MPVCLLAQEPHPVAAAVAFVLTVAVALFAAYRMMAPRDRRTLVKWLGEAPARLGAALAAAVSPGAWRRTFARHPRAWAVTVGSVAAVAAASAAAYRWSPGFRLAVQFGRVIERAEGPTNWAPIIREGRPAIPFLIGQFTPGRSPEERTLNLRVDRALRLTLEWLQWRQPFNTEPLPPEPSGRQRWSRWWEANRSRIPDLGRRDDLYERWRRSRTGPPPLRSR